MPRTSKIGALSTRSAAPSREEAPRQHPKPKLIGALAVLLGALMFVASTSSAASSATQLNVTFVSALINDSYFVTIKCGAMAEAKSLGVKCTACHDFDKPGRTPRMNVAAHMWDGFVTKLSTDGGLFCDSCHHGSLQVLDRSDPHALARWMKQSFVDGLGASGCPQCHGEPFRGRFLADWTTPPRR